MSWPVNKLMVATLVLYGLPREGQTQLQSVPLAGPGSRLSSVMYYDPPNEQRVKLRLGGAEMSPLPGTLFDVKQLTVEQFSLAGRLVAVVEAPQCIYAPWTAWPIPRATCNST